MFSGFRAGLFALLSVVLATVLGAALIPAVSGPDPLNGPAAPVVGAANDTTTPFNLVSMPALIHRSYAVSPLRFDANSSPSRGFVRHAISYRVEGLRLTGTLLLPNHRPAHGVPVIVAVHGWQPAGRYLRGAGLVREERLLASAGYVVLHPDLRNWGGSSVESGEAESAPTGYPADVIAAVLALRESRLPGVDLSRVGLLGRSMGGGVALQAAAAKPDLFDAVMLYSPVSSSAADNFRQFNPWTRGLGARVIAAYGSPESQPSFWARASVRNYVERLDMPVRIDHGSQDVVTLPQWSRATVAAIEGAGGQATFVSWPGEGHRFDRSWPSYAEQMLEYFRANV